MADNIKPYLYLDPHIANTGSADRAWFDDNTWYAQDGNTTGDIGAAIQSYVESMRCSVVRDFCGHGLGKVFHDAPNILHFGQKGTGAELKPGMFFTIEPMVNLGKHPVKLLADGWTAVTRDKSLSAQCEHSVGVTEDGVEIFTVSPTGQFKPPIISA